MHKSICANVKSYHTMDDSKRPTELVVDSVQQKTTPLNLVLKKSVHVVSF